MKISTTIKMLLVLAMTLGSATKTIAQETTPTENYDQKFKLGFGISGGYVFQEPYKLALGVDARLQYDLSKRHS